ncbi:MAG: hypothetical protein Q9191_001886 [Dirinaria sp. TL-2023a]
MQVLASVPLFALACAGLGAVLIANFTTILPVFRANYNGWASRYVSNLQWFLPKVCMPQDEPNPDILYHLGGNGPWIQKLDGVEQAGFAPPAGCQVEQVHMISRHAERYPTAGAGGRMLKLLERIRQSNVTLRGDLGFVNQWQYFCDDSSAQHDQLTRTGPYAGTMSAFRTGTKLRTRYSHLLPSSSSPHRLNFWASSTKRVVDTAEYFAHGLFGLDWASTATLHIVSDSSNLGANTLTPQNTCLRYRSDSELGHNYGYIQLAKFSATYLHKIGVRFRRQNPHLPFTDQEIYSMQEMCGFETLTRGGSPWCAVFTHEDWRNFEYARDILLYYRAGPGNKFGAPMGWLWLNATAKLLQQGPDVGKMFLSFVHDGNLVAMLAALGIFYSPASLPTTYRDPSRIWRLSQVTPMSGRVIFERLTCNPTHASSQYKPYHDHAEDGKNTQHSVLQDARNSTFIRININDGIVALPNCTSGPGSSCPLEEFLAFINRRGDEVGDFRTVCGLGDNVPGALEFLHQR